MTTPTISRRAYLLVRAVEEGAPLLVAQEGLASWALDHPEVDLDERAPIAVWAMREHEVDGV